MEERRSLTAGLLLTAVLGIAGAFAAKVLTSPYRGPSTRVSILQRPVALSTLGMPARQAEVPAAGFAQDASDESQSNVLEIPKASIDFVGAWGGFTRSSIRSVSPNLVTRDTRIG